MGGGVGKGSGMVSYITAYNYVMDKAYCHIIAGITFLAGKPYHLPD